MSMAYKNRHLVGVAYMVAGVLVLFPLVDLAANLWPFDAGRVNWRYGGYGLASGFLLTVLLGTALAVATAVVAGHRTAGRVLGALSGVAGLALLVAAAIYVLDAMQIWPTVPEEARDQFGIGTGKALFKNGIVALGLAWTGVAGWRARAAGRLG
jgi:hypothetical protein